MTVRLDVRVVSFLLKLLLGVICCGEGVAGFSQAIAAAATNVPDAEPSDMVFKKRVDEVNLLFTVVDGKGRFVNKLHLDDFTFLDDQRPPERVRAFQQETDLPLRVAVVIDTSGSITLRFKFEQQAAGNFLKKILRPATDQAFVMGFDTTVHLEQDFTNDVAVLTSAVRRLEPKGDTALFDALVFAADKLRRISEPGVRRVMILISDGDNNHGFRYMHEAEEAALRAEAPIYALSTNRLTKQEYSKGEAVLELLARYTGGELLPAKEAKEVVRAFKQVEEALRSQYVVSYKPADFEPNGKYRQIAVSVRKRKFNVECRRGYFAPRD
jgi:VWFA-related protein